MLRQLFGSLARPVRINSHSLFRMLELNHERFEDDPRLHIPILHVLGAYSLRGCAQYGPAKSFYTDPAMKIKIKPSPPQFYDIPPEESEFFRSSASVSYTSENLAFGRSTFALIIRKDARTIEHLDDSIVFGIYGICRPDGMMTVRKILAPGRDGMTLSSISVTQESIIGAMRYAELCAKTLYEGGSFYPRLCLERSLSELQPV